MSGETAKERAIPAYTIQVPKKTMVNLMTLGPIPVLPLRSEGCRCDRMTQVLRHQTNKVYVTKTEIRIGFGRNGVARSFAASPDLTKCAINLMALAKKMATCVF